MKHFPPTLEVLVWMETAPLLPFSISMIPARQLQLQIMLFNMWAN